ncbi:hypothetical protein Lepto7375DRAFT_7357 [Leptolyngbya sp. PCC 7375]|nr:hypothetical protein Lepto7375DRAFT_7357 [Leptolyngbya sp. PCC 7375]
MTKPITKNRLLQTLENISAWHQRINGHNCDVMHVLCSAGMKSAFDQALGRHDPLAAVKTDLELTVLEVQKSPTALMALQQEWKYNINRKRAKEDRVFKIQEAAGVSGIEWEFFELPDGYTIDYPWFSEDYLPWIEADLHILRWHREQVLAFFLDYLDRSKKQLWRLELDEKRDQWVKCPDRFLLNAEVQMADWCDLCELSDEEIWFTAGRGLDPVSRGTGVSFCASDGMPRY